MIARIMALVGSRRALAAAIVLVVGLAGFGIQSFRAAQVDLDEMQKLIVDTKIAHHHDLDLGLTRMKVLIASADDQRPADVRRNLDLMVALISEEAERLSSQMSALGTPLFVSLDPGRVGRLLDTGQDIIARLRHIVALADAAVVADSDSLRDKLSRIEIEVGLVRTRLHEVFETVHDIEAQIMRQQSDLLAAQGGIHAMILMMVVAISISTLVVLRREVATRAARTEAERKANFLAYFDPLSGLPNRSQFQTFGEELLRTERSAALVLIDLDNFKEINDRLGHAMGDAVLQEVGHRLKVEAEENRGMAARLGGDEFAIILPSDNTAFLHRLCSALIEDIAIPVELGGKSVMPSASIGLATASQMTRGETRDLEMLTRFADFALYASKQAGRSRYTLYDSELDRRFSERREMLEDLPEAIRGGGIEVFLQPKVDMWKWEVYGFEALARWRRRGHLVTPDAFIAIAEEGGLIKELDLTILGLATRILSDWNAEHASGFSLSVNISALHLLDDADTRRLVRAIEAAPLSVELLTLEITETVQLADWSRVGRAIATLRETGCRISIDDFGTGYSSLAYLRTIPADELKIDKSLVAEIEESHESQFILDAVIDLARSLDMTVVVEGIERQGQVSHLCDIGCRAGQGFLFGRPEPALTALERAISAPAGQGDPKAAIETDEDMWFARRDAPAGDRTDAPRPRGATRLPI